MAAGHGTEQNRRRSAAWEAQHGGQPAAVAASLRLCWKRQQHQSKLGCCRERFSFDPVQFGAAKDFNPSTLLEESLGVKLFVFAIDSHTRITRRQWVSNEMQTVNTEWVDGNCWVSEKEIWQSNQLHPLTPTHSIGRFIMSIRRWWWWIKSHLLRV